MSCILKSRKSNTEFPFKMVYFLGVRGLTASTCIVYDCTTSGHMDLSSTYVLYIQYIYVYVQYIYLFISNAIKMYKTLILSFWYSSNMLW